MVRRGVYPLFSYFGVSDFALTPVAALRRVTGSAFVVRGDVRDNEGPGIYIPGSLNVNSTLWYGAVFTRFFLISGSVILP